MLQHWLEPMALLWILFLVLVGLCIGRPIEPFCKVTPDLKGWNFQIVGDENPPCDLYQWANGTDVVLANHKETYTSESDNVVQGWNNTHLHLSVCLADIRRNRDCPREDHELVIRCPVHCSESSEAPQSIGFVFAIVIPVLLTLGLLGFLCWFFNCLCVIKRAIQNPSLHIDKQCGAPSNCPSTFDTYL